MAIIYLLRRQLKGPGSNESFGRGGNEKAARLGGFVIRFPAAFQRGLALMRVQRVRDDGACLLVRGF